MSSSVREVTHQAPELTSQVLGQATRLSLGCRGLHSPHASSELYTRKGTQRSNVTYPRSPTGGVTVRADHDKPSLVWPHYDLVTGMLSGTDTSRLWWWAVHSACS